MIKLSVLVFVAVFLSSVAIAADNVAVNANGSDASSSLEETRLRMEKWIETQQIISKERKDWQQGKDILTGRLELVKKEVGTVEEKTKQAEASVAETNKKRSDLLVETDQLKATSAQLAGAVEKIEIKVRRIYKRLPEPLKAKLQPLYQRIPEEPATTRVSIAERFQNVLGILNELNKANNEISVNYEVRTLADGKPSEVKVIYVGLAQAYYISASGEAGVGCAVDGSWNWVPSKSSAKDILVALEILQGKQTPAFVPLPVKIQ